ncbi:MAG: beta-galactosidase [Oscillospiraceae bacterium]|jgi:beta-galactosidase/beta-glucuronidase|nr:beta-galactosidase [Oscillospiraceae bacterium]
MRIIPRPEHPNPQWQRSSWQNLNGPWQFCIDFGDSGHARGLHKAPADRFDKTILVPFCPESALSGVGCTDFLPAVWYRREIDVTAQQLAGRVALHFGAADYETTVYINGNEAGAHTGGYTSFAFDITTCLRPGQNTLTVRCQDNTRDPLTFSGKQSERFESYGCSYTRTTGIWQTVWLEFLPQAYILSAVYQPDPENQCLHLRAHVAGQGELKARAFWQGKEVGCAAAQNSGNAVRLTLPLAEAHLWEVGKGGLYDLELTFNEDSIKSYFGLRSVRLDGMKFLINGKSVFQRLVLDQGFYPDGIYTAPAAQALKNDIELSMAAGFNGARLHEKVFEPLFLYYADTLGYLCWGEFPDWGSNTGDPRQLGKFLPQWCEAVARDRNHPAIVGWCPHNETRGGQHDDNIHVVYQMTKLLDPDRPCIDTSGYEHTDTDIFCTHDYEQDPARFAAHYADFLADKPCFFDSNRHWGYKGQPMFVSEYGGIGWAVGEGWGYGEGPKSEDAFKARYAGLTTALLAHPQMFGFCYTQLTDVEQERNGIYTYDRQPKFDPAFFREVNTHKAAIED